MPGGDEFGGVFAVAIGGCDDDGGGANAGFGEFIDRREDMHIAAYFGQESLGAGCVQVGHSDKFASVGVTRQFVNMERVNDAHTAEPGDCNFQRFHIWFT
jgi:hypothetical protein